MSLSQPTGNLTGILIPFDLSGATWTATSEAGPRPGVAAFVPSATNLSTAMTVESTGTVSTGDDITVSGARAGVAEPAGGTFRWRSDPGEDYRDWDPPTSIMAFEFIERSTTASHWTQPHAVRLASGRICAVAVRDSNEVVAWYQTSTGAWTSVSIEDTGAATTACIDVLPSGEIRVWYVRNLDGSDCTIRMAYSVDGGASWTVGSSRCLPVPILDSGANITRIRARWHNGNAILIVAFTVAGANFYSQYASSDGGCTFIGLEVYQAANYTAPCVEIRNGLILVAMVVYDATLSGSSLLVPKLWTLASTGQLISGTTPTVAVLSTKAWEWGVYSGGGVNSAELAMLCDDDGMVYLYGVDRDAAGTRETIVSRSYDGGTTWDVPFSRFVWTCGDTGTHQRDLCVVAERSRAILLHRFVAAPGTADDSLCAAYLGGWTNKAMPWNGLSPRDAGVGRWGTTWLPYDKPDDTGTTWTRTVTGAPTTTLSASGIGIVQAGGEQAQYVATPTAASPTYGLDILAEVTVTSGTAVINARISDGATAGFEVAVSVTTTTITLTDIVAASTIGSPVTVGTTNGVQLRIVIQKPTSAGAWAANVGQVRAYYRVLAAVGGPSADPTWTIIESSQALQSAAYATFQVAFGMAAGAAACSYRMFHFSVGGEIPQSDVASSGFPTRGRTWCPPTSPAYVGTYGQRIQAIGGPAKTGDVWSIPSGYDYPVEALDVRLNPSPRRTWRSTSNGTTTPDQQDILISAADLGLVAGDLLGIYLQGANFKSAALYADSGAVTKIADISLIHSSGLGFTRTRGLVYPTGSAGSASDYFFQEGRLVGGTFAYSSGGVARRIGNVEAGNWRGSAFASTTYRGARIHLASYDAGDSASATTGQVWSDRVLVITDIATSTDTLMLRITSQKVADTYFELGTLAIGRMYLWGQRYSRGRSVDVDTGVDLGESASGARRSSRPAPAAEGIEFAWTEGLDTSQLYNGTAADFFTVGAASSAPVSVVKAGVPTGLHGLLRSAAAEAPVVYAPAIPQPSVALTATAPITIVDPIRMLYGRVVTRTLRIDNIQGQEFSSPSGEVFSVGTCRIEEER